jgi:hypothetical protein
MKGYRDHVKVISGLNKKGLEESSLYLSESKRNGKTRPDETRPELDIQIRFSKKENSSPWDKRKRDEKEIKHFPPSKEKKSFSRKKKIF